MSPGARRHTLPEPAVVLDTFWGRLRGALCRRDGGRTTYVLTRTRAIHTWFMPRPIDVAFVAEDGRILEVLAAVPPWRPAIWVRGAAHVVEAPAGALQAWRPGDRVDLPHRRSGQALVEFALVLPVLVTLIIGGIDLITLAGAANLVTQSAQDGVSVWVADTTSGQPGSQAAQDACQAVARNLANGVSLGLGLTGATVTVTPAGGPSTVYALPDCGLANGPGSHGNSGNNGNGNNGNDNGDGGGGDGGNHGQGNGRGQAGTVTIQVQVPFHFIVPLPQVVSPPSPITRSATG